MKKTQKKDKEIIIFTKYLDSIKRYTISSLITFSSVFLLIAGSQLADLPSAEWGKTTIIAIIVTAIRAGIKVLVEKYSGKISEAGI